MLLLLLLLLLLGSSQHINQQLSRPSLSFSLPISPQSLTNPPCSLPHKLIPARFSPLNSYQPSLNIKHNPALQPIRTRSATGPQTCPRARGQVT